MKKQIKVWAFDSQGVQYIDTFPSMEEAKQWAKNQGLEIWKDAEV